MNDAMPERWLPVVGYEGRYEISDRWRVRSLLRRKPLIMNPKPNPDGYLSLRLSKDGRAKMIAVHLLVAEAFNGPRPPGTKCQFIDGNRANLAPGNLMWGTVADVAREAMRRGAKRHCEVCGGPLRHDNTIGICRRTPECNRERTARMWRRHHPKQALMLYLHADETFGRLTLLEDAATSADLVRCRCACGAEAIVRASYIKHGHTASCGCYQRDARRSRGGLSKHPLYRTWYGMINRTTDENRDSYKHYGARGIAVCERWLGMPDGFLNFIADIGPRPIGCTLDRWPDNDGDYEPGNVRWATPKQQVANRRNVERLALDLEKVAAERDALAARVAELEAEAVLLRSMLADGRGTLF